MKRIFVLFLILFLGAVTGALAQGCGGHGGGNGGDIELVEVTKDGVVKVRLTGACGCCPMSQMTLKNAVEQKLKKEVPGIKEVIAA